MIDVTSFPFKLHSLSVNAYIFGPTIKMISRPIMRTQCPIKETFVLRLVYITNRCYIDRLGGNSHGSGLACIHYVVHRPYILLVS